MKTILLLFYLVCLNAYAFAQHVHSIAVGGDLLSYSKPSQWHNNSGINIFTRSDFESYIGDNNAVWGAYYYKNKISIRFLYTTIHQIAYPKIKSHTFDNFLSERMAVFYDFTLGYNFSSLLDGYMPTYLKNKLGIWLYVGVSKLGSYPYSLKLYKSYDPSILSWDENDPWGGYYTSKSDQYINQLRPTAQFMVKYNPIRFFFFGLGATYHAVDKDFRPFSINASLGFQL